MIASTSHENAVELAHEESILWAGTLNHILFQIEAPMCVLEQGSPASFLSPKATQSMIDAREYEFRNSK